MGYKLSVVMFWGALMFLAGHFTVSWADDPKWWFFCVSVGVAIFAAALNFIGELKH